MKKPTPVALFVYRRPEHTRATIEALAKARGAKQTSLFVFSDGPRSESDRAPVQAVRELLGSIRGFKKVTVHESKKNRGLAESVIQGVSSLLKKNERVIVLEDDLVVSPWFLDYMNRALEFYAGSPSVFSVSAFNPPEAELPFPEDYEFDVYCSPRNSSWGWGTWRDRWEKADWKVSDSASFLSSLSRTTAFDRWGSDLSRMLRLQLEGKIDSWSIRWTYAHFKHHALSIVPRHSYVRNIGLDGSGTHCAPTEGLKTDLSLAVPRPRFTDTLFVDERILSAFRKLFDDRPPAPSPNPLERGLRRLLRTVGGG